MSKISTKIAYLTLLMLAVWAMAVAMTPALALAEGGTNYVFGNPENPYDRPFYADPDEGVNPRPSIRNISPKSAERAYLNETITVTGRGFVPGSIARVNGINKPTTYIDSSHLLLRVDLAENYTTKDGFYVSVVNPSPGGGTSNSMFFELKGNLYAPNAVSYNNTNNYYRENDIWAERNRMDGSELASSVILGNANFLPNGLVQWIVVALLILGIIILARRIFGHREAYDSTPLKHA